jgi:hypothetical protein
MLRDRSLHYVFAAPPLSGRAHRSRLGTMRSADGRFASGMRLGNFVGGKALQVGGDCEPAVVVSLTFMEEALEQIQSGRS